MTAVSELLGFYLWTRVDPLVEMEKRVAKRSSSACRALTRLRRKRATCYGKCSTGAAHISSTTLKFGKRRKLHFLKSKCVNSSSQSGKSLLGYYPNLKRSGSPQRLMYYDNGEWNDFPQDLVASVKSQVKNAATEAEIDGHVFLLDFLHMTRIDLVTGLQQPIAWIDEVGNCFFPETFTVNNDLHDCCCSSYVNDWMGMSSKHHDSNKIKLEIEIAIDGSECSKMKESSGESDPPVRKIGVDNKLTDVPHAAEVDFSCSKISDRKLDRASGNVLKEAALLKNESVSENVVRDMFMEGMGSLRNAEIVQIYRGSGTLSKTRLELFMKQAEITKSRRGDANVRYAWFPSSKVEVSNIVTYGIGYTGACKIKPIYGLGVHLVPANHTHTSEKYCDIDENGVKHMILCRVIMGMMELVQCGSEQMYPSSEDYDNGADDLQNPGCFVVWNMNMSTHVYPEYVVTFRVPSDAEGSLFGKENDVHASGVSTSGQGLQLQLDLNAIPPDMGNVCHELPARMSQETIDNMCSNIKSPRSPWMPFSMLFSVISNKIASKELEKVTMNYEKFRNKSMSREDFVKTLRSVVGDALLRSAIANLRCKMPMKAEDNSNAQNQDMKEFRQLSNSLLDSG